MTDARTRLLVCVGTVLALLGVAVPLALGIHLHALGLAQAVLGTVLLVGCSALALNGSRPVSMPTRRAVPAILATTAANAVTPAGVAGALLTIRLHRRSGLTAEESVAATGMRSLMGGLTATAATVVVASSVGTRTLPSLGAFSWAIGTAVVAGLAVALAVPAWRRHTLSLARATWDIARKPRCFASLLIGCVGVTVAQLLTLQGAVDAVGGHLPWLDLLAALMGSAAAKSAVPSPGGVGPVEAALVGGLASLGLGLGTATAAVAVYRTAGHWLPVLAGVLSLRELRRLKLL